MGSSLTRLRQRSMTSQWRSWLGAWTSQLSPWRCGRQRLHRDEGLRQVMQRQERCQVTALQRYMGSGRVSSGPFGVYGISYLPTYTRHGRASKSTAQRLRLKEKAGVPRCTIQHLTLAACGTADSVLPACAEEWRQGSLSQS